MNSDEITTGTLSLSPLPLSSSFLADGELLIIGSMRTTDEEKKEYARKSHEWNIAQPKFRTIFPEYAEKEEKSVPNMSGSVEIVKKEGDKVSFQNEIYSFIVRERTES